VASCGDPGTDDLVGHVLDDRYRIDARIGQGGMGAVYRGTHLLMERSVALKVLRPERAEDENAVRRFVREAKSTFRFDHPNCVRVNDFGIANGLLYLVMEYLDGRTVGEELHYDGPLSTSRVIHVAMQACAALDHAHALNLVHRDLKPDNIMLTRRGNDADFVKVLDFGLAKLFEGPDGFRTTIMSMSPLTQDGIVFGTPEYMSPEQAMGQPLDQRTDIYSLGVVMYEMLTGMVPFAGATFMAMLTKHVKEAAIPPHERRPELGIRPELSAVVMRCMEKQRDDRPATAAELGDELEAMHRGFSMISGRVPRAVAESDTVDLSDDADEVANTLERRLRQREALRAGHTHVSTPVAELRELYRGRRIALRVAGAIAGIAAIIVAAVLISGSGSSATPSGEHATTAVVDAATAAATPMDAAVVVAVHDAATPAAADAATQRRRRPHRRTTVDAKRLAAIRAHLSAARIARASNNTLRQMAEADAVLDLAPNNRMAAYFKGDALLRSGDKANGCRYLHRARVLKQARRRYIGGGCRRPGPN